MKMTPFEIIFESHGDELETYEGGSKVLVIDELNDSWHHVQTVPVRNLMIARSKIGNSAILGRMCKHPNGKFALKLELKASVESGVFSGYECWDIDQEEWVDRITLINQALTVLHR